MAAILVTSPEHMLMELAIQKPQSAFRANNTPSQALGLAEDVPISTTSERYVVVLSFHTALTRMDMRSSGTM